MGYVRKLVWNEDKITKEVGAVESTTGSGELDVVSLIVELIEKGEQKAQ